MRNESLVYDVDRVHPVLRTLFQLRGMLGRREAPQQLLVLRQELLASESVSQELPRLVVLDAEELERHAEYEVDDCEEDYRPLDAGGREHLQLRTNINKLVTKFIIIKN